MTNPPIAPETGRVVSFPGDEERARRLKVEVERLARLSSTEWLYYVTLEGYAEKYGVDQALFKAMVETAVREIEKKQRDEQDERRRIEDRAEKKKASQEKAKAKEERQEIEREDRRARRDARDQERADRRAQQRQREIDRQLAIILKQPMAEHDSRLVEVAGRLGEDINDLRAQFAELLDAERERRGIGDVVRWPEAVNLNTLLNDIHKHRRRYVIIHDEHGAVATTLWTPMSWVHNEIATHSPTLLITSADDEGNAAKTLLCSYLQYQTPRGKMVTDPSGASFFRMIDRNHPTLIIDNAENLFKRKKVLIDLLAASWTRGVPVTRQEHGVTVEYDVFCPKIIGAIAGLNFLPPNAMGRAIHFGMLPKLASETVEEFRYADDAELLTLRQKLARFAFDSAERLRNANVELPEGFDNRLRDNWKLMFAIADLAGGSWPKRIRAAAVKLTKQYYEPSVGRQCLSLFVELFQRSEYDGIVLSGWAHKQFIADPTSVWVNYKGKGPITQLGIANILAGYPSTLGGPIRPDVIHPRGRPADRGYKLEWFETVLRHYLGVEVKDILEQRRKERKT